MKIQDITDNTKFVLYINGKPATEYVDLQDLRNDLREVMKKYPNEKYEIRKRTNSESPIEIDEDWKKLAAAGTLAAAGLSHHFMPSDPPSQQPTQQITQQQTPQFQAKSPIEKKLADAAIKHGITGVELAAFLAQMKHESLNFSKMEEMPKGKHYFHKKYDIRFAPRMAKILGNKRVGDGEKYKGRGLIQLTGKYNYEIAGKALNLPLVEKPELAARPDIAIEVAIWYWKSRVQPHVDNYKNTPEVTKKINSGLEGLDNRHKNFIDYYKYFRG
jgi:predicted chitinase